jgi:UDP-N-acetylglucosamine 2-epimerase (non-hydrolysing)
VFVTGNTVIDALKISVHPRHHFSVGILNRLVASKKRLLLVTMHRRENWGEPMRGAAKAIKRLAKGYSDCEIVFPVHLNPMVREVINPVLRGIPNVHLIEPLDYSDFVNIMARSYLIITDSGGVQEEGPSLGKPVLVLREVTERPEAVEYGTAKLVGLNEGKILYSARKLMDDRRAYDAMATATNPYGDGFAARRIVGIISKYFGLSRTTIKDFARRV